MGDPGIELIAGRQRSSEAASVPFIDESNTLWRDSQPFRRIVSGVINGLAHSPDRELVAFPFGDATIGLQGNGNRARKRIAKLLYDIRACKCFIDVAPFEECLHDSGPWAATRSNRQIWRIRRRCLLEIGSEGKNVVFRLNGRDGILGEILGIRGNHGYDLTLEKKLLGKGIGFRRILGSHYVLYSGLLLRILHFTLTYSNMCMTSDYLILP